MVIPTPYTVGHRTYVEGAENAHGQARDEWAEPIDVPVHAIAPGASLERQAEDRDVSEIAWTVYAPAGTAVGARDLIVHQGKTYEVNGAPDDWTMGPWSNPAAGVVIELRRRSG